MEWELLGQTWDKKVELWKQNLQDNFGMRLDNPIINMNAGMLFSNPIPLGIRCSTAVEHMPADS